MKILLDESVPRQLRRLLVGRDVTLTEEMGWKGIKNGSLLQLAEARPFDVFITADQQLRYQQNMKGRRLAIVVLPYNRRKLLPQLVPAVESALSIIQPGDYIELPWPARVAR